MPHVGAAALAQYVVPAAIGAGAQIFGAHKASKSNDKATATEAAANAAALQYQKEQQAKADARQAELDRKEEARWNAEQANIAADRARLAPLQALKAQLAGATADRMGFSLPDGYGASQGASSLPSQIASASPGSIASLSRYPSPPLAPPVQDEE